MLSTIILPRFDQVLARQRLGATVRAIANGFQDARIRALTQQIQTEVIFDLPNQRIITPGRLRTIHLPPDIQISLTSAHTETGGPDIAGFRFYPDGSNTGGRVTLKGTQLTSSIDLDWLTGQIAFHAR